ncbi:11422_t:CDS:10, partial [Funneliformis geosporum]
KRILYSKIEGIEYQLKEYPEVINLKIPTNISQIIRNVDADCNFFATVVDTTKSSGFFTCQILCPSMAEPRLVIHCTHRRFKKRQCKLKIRWMKIFCVSASTKLHNESLDIGRDTTEKDLFFGIPTLSTLDSSNKRLIIGHYFKNSYDNLPSFTFYTLVISNYYNQNTYGTLNFQKNLFKNPYIEFRKDSTNSLKPKYVSLYFTVENNYGPIFLKQNIYRFRIKDIICKSKDCTICINKTKISKKKLTRYFDPYESDDTPNILSYKDEDNLAKVKSFSIPSRHSTSASIKSQNSKSMIELPISSLLITDIKKTTIKLTSDKQQMIRQFKLNHGLLLNGTSIQPSKQAFVNNICFDFDISLFEEEPIVYTRINDVDCSKKLSEICINFPIAEINYKGDYQLESVLKYTVDKIKLQDIYGHFLARKFLVGGQLFIKGIDSSATTQIDKYSRNNSFDLNLLPRIETLDGKKLSSHEELSNWMNNLYQKKEIEIISYENLISISQLTESKSQPGIANFDEKLNLEEWIGGSLHDNLMSWASNFHLFQGLIFNGNNEIEISKKSAIKFINELLKVNKSDRNYLKVIKPSTKLEVNLISNNILTIKNLNSFPFIKTIVKSYGNYNHVLIKFEECEIFLNKYNIKPTKEFEEAIEQALDNMNPFELYKTYLMNMELLIYGIDNNNGDEYYKRINVEPRLKDDDYRVFGSIISKNYSKLKEFCINFGIYEFNGFYAIIRKLIDTSINITECYVLWMIVGKPSKLSTFSPKNRECKIKCFEKSITYKPNKSNYYIELSLELSQGRVIFVNKYNFLTNYEHIKLVSWKNKAINVQIVKATDISIDIILSFCILTSNHVKLKIDNGNEVISECSFDLLGYSFTEGSIESPLSSLTVDTKVETKRPDNKTNEYLLVMQYADGGDLRKYLHINFHTLYWHDKKRLAFQIAEGLNYLHNENILHRDLHSRNIVIHENNAKITDFGISKYDNNQSSTIHYSNFEISSGRPPFKDCNKIALAGSIVNNGARETTEPNTPKDYEKFYQKCWDQELERRTTIDEVLEEFKKLDFGNIIKNENESSSESYR